MNLKRKFIEIRDNYVINQAKRAVFPEFPDDETIRLRVCFSGRVQNVGFRLEVYELAKRLGLTGYCRNLENGDVLAELQGPKNRIWCLISYMESLKRIKITKKETERLAVDGDETEFLQK